jgi:hypothetical protein
MKKSNGIYNELHISSAEIAEWVSGHIYGENENLYPDTVFAGMDAAIYVDTTRDLQEMRKGFRS